MKLILSLLFLSFALLGNSLQVTLDEASIKSGKVTIDNIDIGVSGFVVRDFDSVHSAIIASATVTAFDADKKEATLRFGEYTWLRQNSLPKGEWQPKKGDRVILAFAYARATLIAPDAQTYFAITSKVPSIDWVHPDELATFLSYRGHPSPLDEDFRDYCDIGGIGLYYFYVDKALFTVDCKSLSVLQITPAPFGQKEPQKPFYSRIEKINANWFGAGSSEIEDYESYYLELLVLNNTENEKLYRYFQENMSDKKVLLKKFATKER